MKDVMAANVAAFEQTMRSTLALAEDLTGRDWERATECPGWNVRDVFSHLVGIEMTLLGEDPAPGHVLPADLPHVRNEMGRGLEAAVDARRSRSGPEVLAELREVVGRRLAELPGIDPGRPAVAPTGREMPYAELMGLRAFDCWVHEQDVRRAVGRPGNLDAPATDCVRRVLLPGLPVIVAKRAGAAPGRSVTFEVTGPVAFTEHVLVGDDGRAARVGSLEGGPTAVVRTDWESFVRLLAGRCGPADVTVEASGDRALADRVLAHMGITV
ncbi:maleylpyruvate isomerase family mycothiol-dependent enzyme [Actinomadura kijaniata]|uniref:Uncharacterized protein (TIGR03083 family) n=1 Tax=Actinomadura namibiensis TaxID=182080 RepID=A0A7W3LNE4_ACTNM|nr:maleylpyruvate isomerase family mycothiol-dependent enzyme [Actinomadura namibiensis]MBA8951225.1 uncharacterized protein (TIGR03083 family) [Actinomadura namibiensis]